MFNKKKIQSLEAENKILKDLLNFYIAMNEFNLQMRHLDKIKERVNQKATIPIYLN